MYLEGKKRVRFLLSAKRFEGKDSTFYISLNEDFPGLEYLPIRGHIARLERQEDKSYLLTLNQCHLCDKMLGHFHCGRGELEREVIARISHYFKVFRPCNAEYRYFQIHIPFISKYGKRKIWCPRAFHRSNAQLGNEVNVNEAIKRDGKASIVLKSKPPIWNAELKSLVVKFQGNRVLIPSVKNFMLYASADASASYEEEHDTETDEDEMHEESNAQEENIFQFDGAHNQQQQQSQQTQRVVPSSSSGPGGQKRVVGVTEVPKIVSSLRWRSDSSIESPMRKTSRGKSFATGTPPSHTTSPKLTHSTNPNNNIQPNINTSNTNTTSTAPADTRYASMFQYSFPEPNTSTTNSNTNTTTSSSLTAAAAAGGGGLSDIRMMKSASQEYDNDSFQGITINRTLPLSSSFTSSSSHLTNHPQTTSNATTINTIQHSTAGKQTAPPTPSPETSPPPSRTNTTSYSETIPAPPQLPPTTPAKERERQRQEWKKIRQAYAEKYQQYILGG
jgi:hypothetical protein